MKAQEPNEDEYLQDEDEEIIDESYHDGNS